MLLLRQRSQIVGNFFTLMLVYTKNNKMSLYAFRTLKKFNQFPHFAIPTRFPGRRKNR